MNDFERDKAINKLRSIMDARINGESNDAEFNNDLKLYLQSLIDEGCSLSEMQELTSAEGLDILFDIHKAN